MYPGAAFELVLGGPLVFELQLGALLSTPLPLFAGMLLLDQQDWLWPESTRFFLYLGNHFQAESVPEAAVGAATVSVARDTG